MIKMISRELYRLYLAGLGVLSALGSCRRVFALPVGPVLKSVSITRAQFMSSSVSVFLASTGIVWASDPEECLSMDKPWSANPRYIDKELQMQYGENSGVYF